MRVLLTGATGFVGSHILDALCARGIATVALVRSTSSRRFIAAQADRVELREGSITEPDGLVRAVDGVTHAIHCAGLTKAVRPSELFRVNQGGTRNLVVALNAHAAHIERVVHLSSLAVSGPGTAAAPARESATPRPVSVYGHSKAAAEREYAACRAPFLILRPCAVYGPRDAELLALVRAVRSGWLPCFGGGRQELSLVYARDLAEVVVQTLTRPIPLGVPYHVAADEVVTARGLGEEIARQLGVSARRLVLPNAAWRPLCLAAGMVSRWTGRASILANGKCRELTAPGWVAETRRLRFEAELSCPTGLRSGLEGTLRWYRAEGWR